MNEKERRGTRQAIGVAIGIATAATIRGETLYSRLSPPRSLQPSLYHVSVGVWETAVASLDWKARGRYTSLPPSRYLGKEIARWLSGQRDGRRALHESPAITR